MYRALAKERKGATYRSATTQARTLFRKQRALARNTLPQAVAFDPRIRVARTNRVRPALICAGLAINSGYDRGVAVDLHAQAFVVQMIGFLVRRDDPLHVLFFVHERAVVIRVNERVGNK